MKSVAKIPWWWKTIRERFSSSLIFSILVLLAALSLGVAISLFNPVYGFAVAGALVMVIIMLLRWDELAVALIIAVHLWVDWYLNLHLVGILMALVLLFVYYFGRSAEHPWIRMRPLWLWMLFLLLTIYPAIKGGRLLLFDALTYYPSIVLGSFLMFWIGRIIAKDIRALRLVFQLLSIIAALVAVHTIIETTTGVFLFASTREEIHLLTANNLIISGTNASRAASFFADPNLNGCFLAMMFFLPLGLFIESKLLLGKFVFFAEMVVIFVAMMSTYSNGSWVALLGGVIAFEFWVGSQHYRFLWIIIVASIALIILVLFPSQIAIQLQHASNPSELLLRQGAWETGIRVMEAYPLFGVGMGSQAYLILSNPYRVPAQFVPVYYPHNVYLEWGAMAGIPVLVVFLLLQGYAFWCMWRNWRSIDVCYRPLLGGGITALIVLSVNSISIEGWANAVIATVGWLIAGMITSPLITRCLHQQTTSPNDRMAKAIPAGASRMDKVKLGS